MSDFGAEFDREAQRALFQVKHVRNAAIMSISERIILDTPIDTGALRGSWRTQVGSPNAADIPIEDRSGSIPIAENVSVVNKVEMDQTVYLSNGLDYSEELEDGKSYQAPQGMVQKNIVDWPDEVVKAFDGSGTELRYRRAK